MAQKIKQIIDQVYKRGQIYCPDDLENLPKDFVSGKFDDIDDAGKYKTYELGSQKCVKSFRVKITLYE